MNEMFKRAINFEQKLGNWNVEMVTDMKNMFSENQLSVENYDSLLIGWARLDLQDSLIFTGGTSNYCNGASARASIISNHGWTIIDGEENCITAVEDINAQLELAIYPNPATNFIHLEAPSPLQLRIYNILGEQIKDITLNKGRNIIDVSDFNFGVYYLASKRGYLGRFVKN